MTSAIPSWAYGAALAAMPRQTHVRLRRLLSQYSPEDAWAAVMYSDVPIAGISHDALQHWRTQSCETLHRTHEQCIEAGVAVWLRGDVDYPMALMSDPDAPAVLFALGTVGLRDTRRVGIVGTRHATQSGQHFARTLGRQLTDAGISVVSGLARGIDIASHRGALHSRGAPPVAVVAGGPNVVYPKEHWREWRDITERGVIISESPPGIQPEPYRFPLRNRILASLCTIVVVVESRTTGGSMITVDEAVKRGITVMAVPGSPHIAPSQGTNALLRDGCAPVTSVDDVLMQLGLDTSLDGIAYETRTPPDARGMEILEVLGDTPRTVDEIACRGGHNMIDVAVVLGQLESLGWVAHADGWWEALTR